MDSLAGKACSGMDSDEITQGEFATVSPHAPPAPEDGAARAGFRARAGFMAEEDDWVERFFVAALLVAGLVLAAGSSAMAAAGFFTGARFFPFTGAGEAIDMEISERMTRPPSA
ncbi:MAG: hypothetical protein R3C70_16170 [Geminicoccaceae bacterium]